MLHCQSVGVTLTAGSLLDADCFVVARASGSDLFGGVATLIGGEATLISVWAIWTVTAVALVTLSVVLGIVSVAARKGTSAVDQDCENDDGGAEGSGSSDGAESGCGCGLERSG